MNKSSLTNVLSQTVSSCERLVGENWDWPSPDSAFASFVYHVAGETGPAQSLSTIDWPTGEPLQHAPSLAAFGFLMFAGGGEGLRDQWRSSVARLVSSNLFTDRQSFAHRPVELLGMLCGVAALGNTDASIAIWARRLAEKTRSIHGTTRWAGWLQASAESVVGLNRPSASLSPQPTLDELAAAQLFRKIAKVESAETGLDEKLLNAAVLETISQVDVARAATIHWAIRDVTSRVVQSSIARTWQVNQRRQDAEALVVELCRRFHICADRLNRRHESRQAFPINDEYDVQDLMHAMLLLHFDDVRAEESAPSVGGKNSRMDFLLKKEKIAIETKMTRKGLDQKKVGDELAIDMMRYRPHPDYRTLICFVYDPKGFCDNPVALESDMKVEEGEYRAIVVVCPHRT